MDIERGGLQDKCKDPQIGASLTCSQQQGEEGARNGAMEEIRDTWRKVENHVEPCVAL